MPSSILLPGERIIDDEIHSSPETRKLIELPDGFSKGYEPWQRDVGFGAAGAAEFDLKLIPKSEWEPRIKEMEEKSTRSSDMILRSGLPCKDQNGTNYCWINAPVYAIEERRVLEGQEMVILSPGSVGGPIKGYRNQGGWGLEGIKYIVTHGVCPVQVGGTTLYPANQTSRPSASALTKIEEERKKYKVLEWLELRPRNIEHLITCLLSRIPVAVGYNWWGHEVTACDAVWLDGEVAIRIRNSWSMSWGTKGYSILRGSKMLPDDAVAPRTTTITG